LASRTVPAARLMPWCGVSTTTTQAIMWSWMLQPSTAMPLRSNSTGLASSPL
jgi:hypothetical protein